jgi:hypothetical protein
MRPGGRLKARRVLCSAAVLARCPAADSSRCGDYRELDIGGSDTAPADDRLCESTRGRHLVVKAAARLAPLETEPPKSASGRSKRRWRYDDFNESCCHIIDEARDEPFGRQCWNGSQQSNVAGNRRSWIKDRFCRELSVWYLKILGQHGGVADQTGDAAISMLKNDEVKLPTPPGIVPAT